MRTLGIDLGNGKVKYCLLEGESAHWWSFSLPYTASLMPDRSQDFEQGLPATLGAFLGMAGVKAEEIQAIAVATSHSFSYPTFEAAHLHTCRLLDAMFGDKATLIGCDGRLYPVSEASALRGRSVLRFAGSKYYGSPYLAAREIRSGIAVDTGTTSTDVIPILAGQIDPHHRPDPDAYWSVRVNSGRFHWLGMTATPLDYISREATAHGQTFPLIPRGGTTEALCRVLDLVPESLAQVHAYGNLYPDEASAYAQIAQSFGMDPEILPPSFLRLLADDLYTRMVDRIADGIRRVCEETGLDPAAASGMVMGLGGDAVGRKALARAGFHPERIISLEDRLSDDLASASTAYGLALCAREALK